MEKHKPHTSKNFRKLLRISFVGHIFNDMYWFIIPLVLPIIKNEFHLNYTQSGLLLTSYTMVGAFCSLITGYVGDRMGRRFILSWGFFLGSLAFILCALSSGYWQLFFALIILGVGISAFHPSMIAVLSNSFFHKRGAMLGIFQFWGAVGTFSAVLIISLLIGALFTWRQILLILSVPGLVFAPLFFKSLKPLLERDPSFERKKKGRTSSFSQEEERITFLPFLIFMVANALFTMTNYGVMNFIPTYLVEVKSLDLTLAGYSFLIVVAGGFLGTVAGGKASDKLSPLLALILFVAFGGPMIILITFLERYILLITSLVLYGISFFGFWAPQQAYLAENTSQRSRGGVYGIIFCLTYIVGAIAPGITGFIADHLNFSSAIRITTIPIFVSLILLFYLRRRQKSQTSL